MKKNFMEFPKSGRNGVKEGQKCKYRKRDRKKGFSKFPVNAVVLSPLINANLTAIT